MVKSRGIALCAAAAMATLVSVGIAQATPAVDGVINPSDYSYVISQSLAEVTGGPGSTSSTPISATAQLYVTTDSSGNLYVGLNVPQSIVDNSYGSNAYGWGSGGHTLNDLLGSDGADFTINNSSGNAIFGGFMDYVSGGGYSGPGGTTGPGPGPGPNPGPGPGGTTGPGHGPNPGPGPGSTGGTGSTGSTFQPLTSDGFNASYGNSQDDASLTTGSTTDIIAAQTSMGYNYNLFKNASGAAGLFGESGKTPNSPAVTLNSKGQEVASSSSYAGWQFGVQYTFEVSGSFLKANGFSYTPADFASEITVPYIHASPSKLSGIRFTTTPNTAVPTPLPNTLLLASAGLLGIGLMQIMRPRRRKA